MKVKFLPSGKELEVDSNQSVMELAHKNGIYIKSVCNGVPSCAECRVKIVDGDYNVLPPAAKELNLIGNGYFIDQRRLSCQLICFGDLTVDLTEQIEKEKVSPKKPLGMKGGDKSAASAAVTGVLGVQKK
jgi:2Fe-2S ferredoxin